MEEISSFNNADSPAVNLTKLSRPKKYRALFIAGAVLILALAGLFGYNYFFNKQSGSRWQDVPAGLVADKISQSAAVIVSLPDAVKISVAEAKDKISFDPQVLGSWSAGVKAQELVFKPAKPLDLGKHYNVTIAAGDIHLAKDFLVDEDPKVGGIFPHDGTEAPETSAITIVFNRPMVPLTTLDQQLSSTLPITVTPNTPGKFKWVTTRTLEFTPNTRLARSSHYQVSVASGFVSMDGLSVAPFQSSFTTRPLRYNSDTIGHGGVTLYDEPVTIVFNQPVDLAKTEKFITVKNSDTQNNIPFVVEYGTRTVSLGDQTSTAEYTDKSVLYVYAMSDRFGRQKFWDNKTGYDIGITGAAPLAVTFTDNSISPISWLWTFGDGTTSTLIPALFIFPPQ